MTIEHEFWNRWITPSAGHNTYVAPTSTRTVKLVHVAADGSRRTIATDVEFADTLFSQLFGLMFRRSIPDDYALVFRFDTAKRRGLHMLFVPFPIDAIWLDDEEVTKVTRLAAWIGTARGYGDTVIELPSGAADGVAPGDSIRLVE